MKKSLAMLCASIAVAGCGSNDYRPPDAPSDRPPAYRDGYADGCGSAQENAKYKKDLQRMKDSLYANGWYDGFEECGPSRRSNSRNERERRIPPVNPR
jgi:hypothetical protein